MAAPGTAEPLEAFLKAHEKSIEALLAQQEAWATANIEVYAPRPAALAYKADLWSPAPDSARVCYFHIKLNDCFMIAQWR